MAATPEREVHNHVDVLHPRYVVIPKIGMSVTPFFLALSARSALKTLQREGFDFDLIDAHYYYPDGVAAAMLGAWFKKPVVITARGTDVNLIPEHAIPRVLVRWASRQAKASIGVSAALVDRMRELGMGTDRLHVMRNGVDTQRFHIQLQNEAQRDLGITHGPAVLTVGNLHEHKGQRLVLEAFALLHKQQPAARLYIVGEGPDRSWLQQQAQVLGLADVVTLVGTVPNTDLARWYSAADVLVLASSREGWPNVLLEAMACGTPVVASRVGGVPEIVQTPLSGRVVSERTAAAFAGAIRDLLDQRAPDAAQRSTQRAAVRQYAQGFGWDRTSQDQLQLFNTLAFKTPVAHP